LEHDPHRGFLLVFPRGFTKPKHLGFRGVGKEGDARVRTLVTAVTRVWIRTLSGKLITFRKESSDTIDSVKAKI
jgi:hypothetical protein